jgi:hypothetical protein
MKGILFMKQNNVKKIISLILSFTMIFAVCSTIISAQDLNSYEVSHFSSGNVNYTLKSQDTLNKRISTIEYENQKITAIFDKEKNAITIISDDINYKGTTIDLNAANSGAMLMRRVITSETDKWFGYSWYMNTDSARGDYYWRLDNPNRSPVRKDFFTTAGDDNHYYAMRFQDDVQEMITYQEMAENRYGQGAVQTALLAILVAIAGYTGILEPAVIIALAALTLESLN